MDSVTIRNTTRQNPETKVYEPVEMRSLVFLPVYSNVEGSENRKFWDSSPSGRIELGTVNPEAWKCFSLDKEYYIDFTEAK